MTPELNREPYEHDLPFSWDFYQEWFKLEVESLKCDIEIRERILELSQKNFG